MDLRDQPLSVLILAAGKGSRMKSALPKVMHPIGGRSMLGWVLETVSSLQPIQTVVLASPKNKADLEQAFPKITCVVQDPPLGTGHAARLGVAHLDNERTEDVFVLCGDTPFIPLECLQAMQEKKAQADAAIVVLAMSPPDLKAYGRLKVNPSGEVTGITEARDLTTQERDTPSLCHSGVMLLDGKKALPLLSEIPLHPEVGEYYLTDIIELASRRGLRCCFTQGPWESLLGVNDRQDLSKAEAYFQEAARQRLMCQGVTLLDPSSTFLSFDSVVERDVTLHPFVKLGPGVVLREGSQVLPFSYLSGTHLGERATVGPFCHLREGVTLQANAIVGNFVEVKESSIGEAAKIKHLSYLGNCHVGPKANVGAGTVTCNYDGHHKHPTHIGEGVLVGSNSALIAPLTLGQDSVIGAGSVLTQDVPSNALSLSRPEQQIIQQGATRFHQKKKGQ